MPAIPLRGDRSAWDAENYKSLHTNDINTSPSAIHHTLGIGANQAASGSHTHDIFSGGSSIAGELLTSKGSGSVIWAPLGNHSHTGSASGDGGKLDWDNVWSDAIHDHSVSSEGGSFDASNLTSGSALAGYALTADGIGNAAWGLPSANISLNNLLDVHIPSPVDGDVLTWSNASGSWIAYPLSDWRVYLTQDDTANDSDKTFSIPIDAEWQILWIWIEYTSTASVGIRQLEVQIQDISSNIIAQFQPGVTQSDSLTYKYLFGIGVADLTSVRDGNNVTTPLPAGTFLSGGQKIRVWDNNVVDSSADDMVIRLQYASRTFRVENYYIIPINISTHLQTSDKVNLTQHQVLAINNSTNAHTSGNIELTQRYATLIVENSTHLMTSEIVTLPVQGYLLPVHNSFILQTSDNIALAQNYILSANNSSMLLRSDKVVLSIIQHYYIVSQDSVQSQTSDNITTTFFMGVLSQNSLQAHTSDNIILTTTIVSLVINNSTQIQFVDIPNLVTNIVVLRMNRSTQAQSSNSVSLSSNIGVLNMNSSIMPISSEKPTLIFNQKTLAVDNSGMNIKSDKVNTYSPP